MYFNRLIMRNLIVNSIDDCNVVRIVTGDKNRAIFDLSHFTFEVTEQDTEDGLIYELFIFHPDFDKKKRMFSLLKKEKCSNLIDLVIDNYTYLIDLYANWCMYEEYEE